MVALKVAFGVQTFNESFYSPEEEEEEAYSL